MNLEREKFPLDGKDTKEHQSCCLQTQNVEKSQKAHNLNFKNNFLIRYMRKNKASLIFICISYLLTSCILMSYGVVFYFIAYYMYSKEEQDVLLCGQIICGTYLALGICDTIIKAKQK